MNSTHKAILRALLYFDLFNHPLSKMELFKFCTEKITLEDMDWDLEELKNMQIIGVQEGYIFIKKGFDPIEERIIKLKRSEKYNRIAQVVSALIYRFPFVRAVLISGSLSKKVVSRQDDIDFFVITAPGRVWVCRSLLMLFKKIFLFNSSRFFCINYFIDTVNLNIPDRNIFTATELAFLQPVYNFSLYTRLIDSNQWMKDIFPNWTYPSQDCINKKNGMLKRTFEKILSGRIGDKFDDLFLRIYRKRSMKKFGNLDMKNFHLNFRNEKHVSKHHPNAFQQLIIDEYGSRIQEFEYKYNLNITN
jgi:hypothetical protein